MPKFRTLMFAVCAVVLSFILSGRSADSLPDIHETHGVEDAVDNDWFMLQRIYPNDDLNPRLYEQARQYVETMALTQHPRTVPAWQIAGPTNIGGRITAIALHPANPNIIYAGAASGGLWKSSDNGATWTSIFNGSFSIGSLALDPNNPETLYAGTGEANPGGVAIYPGNGLWRSTDGGQTWTNLGLSATGQLGKIDIHPSNSNTIFVAAQGLYRSRTQDRGVYRSIDAGASWQRVLYTNDTTGACDVIIDRTNPSRIVAGLWSRYRPLTYSIVNSATSGLWLSTDGGDSWTQVTSGFPANDVNTGRISLAESPSSPNIYFALVSNGAGVKGIYRSSDNGSTWTVGAATFGSEGQVWYNNILAVHPTNPDLVYAGMTRAYQTTNGGTTWSTTANAIHVDHHAIAFDQTNPNRIVIGNDGGVFVSSNGGSSWVKSLNLPISQFYAGTIDFTNPQRTYGGLQDNNCVRTLTGSTDDWAAILGGDGFYVLVDPTNPNRIYAESQNGGLAYSTNGTTFTNGTTGISSSDRKGWCTPMAMDLTSPLTLYTGTHRVYRTTNGMANWTPISGDLTRGQNGRLGQLTTIDVGYSNPNVIYAGADDGSVSVTTDGGTTWTDISASLPVRWVTRVTVDPDSANVCYVTLSGYLEYQNAPHIYRTTNFGATWQAIGGNLPDIPLNDVLVDAATRPRLYVASDAGVFYSTNYGSSWEVLGSGLPDVPVHDLTLHAPTRKLVAFTHGRSSWSIDVSNLTTGIAGGSEGLPQLFLLDQNYPNPFNPSTTIRFSLEAPAHAELAVYDITGKRVEILVDETLREGTHEKIYDASALASGTYFYRLRVGTAVQTKSMTVLK